MATLFELAARLQTAGAAEALLLLVVKVTLILAIARLIVLAMPHASASTRHLIATAALIAVAAMPILTVITPSWHLGVFERLEAPAPADQKATTIGETGEEEAVLTGGTLDTAIGLARATGLVEQPLTVAARAINVAGSTWKGLIVISLALVASLMLLQMITGMFGVGFVARKAEELTDDRALLELDNARDHLALHRHVRLLRSSRITVPVIWGIFRPVLLLPMDVTVWPVERLRVVLLHELAHLKRLDGISLILTRLAVSVFWFHPLAWSLERAGRADCERACDDLVLASGTKPSDYADHLLAIARSMPSFDPFRSVTLAMSRKSQLEGRLLSILSPQGARRIFTARGVAFACLCALLIVIPVSAVRLAAQPQAAPVMQAKQTPPETSGSEMTVVPDVEAIGDYFLAKLGKTGDRFTHTPKNGKEWYQRGYDLYNAERHTEAAAAFERAAQDGHRKAASLYNASCSYALTDDKENALKLLSQAIAAGWDDIDHIADDSDLDPVRSDPRFQSVVKNAHGAAVTRRVTETVDRFQKLQASAISPAAKNVAHDDEDWFEVGLDLLRLRRLDESIQAFQHSVRAEQKSANSMYNIACAYSLKGDTQNGLRSLEKAIDLGFSSSEKLKSDPDIRHLRQQAGFNAVLQMADDLDLRACCDGREDGEWDSWPQAAAHFQSMTARYPRSGRAWFNLGYTALQAGDNKTALEGFSRAVSLNHRPGTSSYNIACTHARAGNHDAAFQWLDKARASGFKLGHYLSNDEDLESLHDDPRYDQLRKVVKAESKSFIRIKNKNGKVDIDFDIDEMDFDFDFDFGSNEKHTSSHSSAHKKPAAKPDHAGSTHE